MTRKLLLILLLIAPLAAHAQSTALNAIATNPSSSPADGDKMIDETGTVSYMLTYLNNAKYVVGKVSGDCTVNTSTFAITCTKINGLTIPALVANDCLQANGSATAWVMGACGGGGGGATTFDQVQTGTNVQYTMTCGSSGGNSCLITHSGSGAVDANFANGTAIPANAGTTASPGILITNNSAQFTVQNFAQLPAETFAAINAGGCTGVTDGQIWYVKDSNAAPGSPITAGGGSNKVLALCVFSGGIGTWVAH